jgi:hypothetical protein
MTAVSSLAMNLKDEFDKIVRVERAKLETADRLNAEFPERQRQRFCLLRTLVEELGTAVGARFLRTQIENDGATVTVGRLKQDSSSFVTDMQWELRPNYSVHFDATSLSYRFREESGFRVAETRCPRFPADDAATTMMVFETEALLIDHLIRAIATRIAEYLHRAENLEMAGCSFDPRQGIPAQSSLSNQR